MEVWVRLSLVHFKGRSRKLSFRTYLDMKLFRPLTGLTPIPGSCQPFQGNESHDINPTNRDGFVPGSFQIGYGLLNKLHSCSVNGFSVYPRGHIARLWCDTLVCQQPEFDVVQLLKQLVELDLWLACHLAQCCKDGVWMLHCVLLSSSYNRKSASLGPVCGFPALRWTGRCSPADYYGRSVIWSDFQALLP